MDDRNLVILGHGYSAAALAASLPPGWRVAGTTRSGETASKMKAAGVAPLIWEDAVAVDAALRGASHVLASMPPGSEGDPALLRCGAALGDAKGLRWLGYLSTTGVYGDRGGGWVDEDSPLEPVGRRGSARVAAETGWAETGLPLHIFRLPGIYGPGRSALDRVRRGSARRIVKPGQVFSRIHVADLARSVAASMERPMPGRAYNVADNEPAPPQDVIAFAAELLGLPVPPDEPFETAEMSAMGRSFYGESKRVSNRRMREELGVEPDYPDYRAGLRAILAAGS